MPEHVLIDFDTEQVTKAQLEGHQRTLAYWKQRRFPEDKPAPVPPADTLSMPANAAVVFREDWRGVDGIYPPSVVVKNRRWTDGSDTPNAEMSIATLPDGRRELDALVRDALGHNDGARCFQTMDDARWNDLRGYAGKRVYWLVQARLVDMPVVQSGAGMWFSLAQIKRHDAEAPAFCQVNVRGDNLYNELYLVLGGQSYYFTPPAKLDSNVGFTFMLEALLSEDAAVGEAWLHYGGQRIGGMGALLLPDTLGAFALCAYGNNAPSLHVRFPEVAFAIEG